MYSELPSCVKTVLHSALLMLGIATLLQGITHPIMTKRIYAITITEMQAEYKKLQNIRQQFQIQKTVAQNTILQIIPFQQTEEEKQVAKAPSNAKTPQPQGNVIQKKQQSSSMAAQVIQKVNEVRSKNNLTQLRYNESLANAAQKYAQEMAQNNNISHIAKNGSDFLLRNTQAGYTPFSWMAENIAAGQKTPQEVVEAWLQSPTHRENMLHPQAQETGVGLAIKIGTQYTYYWVQEFGAR